MPRLQYIIIDDTSVENFDDCEFALPYIRELSANNCKLKNLNNIEKLNIISVFRNDGNPNLKDITQLSDTMVNELWLRGSGVDHGQDDNIHQCRRLQVLHLEGSEMSKKRDDKKI